MDDGDNDLDLKDGEENIDSLLDIDDEEVVEEDAPEVTEEIIDPLIKKEQILDEEIDPEDDLGDDEDGDDDDIYTESFEDVDNF